MKPKKTRTMPHSLHFEHTAHGPPRGGMRYAELNTARESGALTAAGDPVYALHQPWGYPTAIILSNIKDAMCQLEFPT